MLQRVSNDLNEPISMFYHDSQLYTHVGPHHDLALEQFSVVTRHQGQTTAGEEHTQCFVFDPEQCDKFVKTAVNGKWFVVELVRDVAVEVQSEHSETFGQCIAWNKCTRSSWRASTKNEWKHTLDILRSNHDEDLVVAAAHEEVVKDLGGGVSLKAKHPLLQEQITLLSSKAAEAAAEPRYDPARGDRMHPPYPEIILPEPYLVEYPKRKFEEDFSDEERTKRIKTRIASAIADVHRSIESSGRPTLDGFKLCCNGIPCSCHNCEGKIHKKEGAPEWCVPCRQVSQSSTACPCTPAQSAAEAPQLPPPADATVVQSPEH